MNSFLLPTVTTLVGTYAILLLIRRDRASRGDGLRRVDLRGLALDGAVLIVGTILVTGRGEQLLGRSVQAATPAMPDWIFTGERGPTADRLGSPRTETWVAEDGSVWSPLEPSIK